MKVAILTIPKHRRRVWALFGHLQTIGFPVVENPEAFKVYNGYDASPYPTRRDGFKALVAHGHEKYQWHLENLPEEQLEGTRSLTMLVTLGMLNILRTVAAGDEPVLVLENDAYLIDLSYADLVEHWNDLLTRVGYQNINVAMLTVIRPNLEQLKADAELVDVDDFWVKGACGPGQTGNIYTPHGAAYILEKHSVCYNIERMLYEEIADLEGIYSTEQGILDLDFFSNFDSTHTDLDKGFWIKLLDGEQL